MKSKLLLYILLFLSITIQAQTSRLDSLKGQLDKSINETEKARLYNEISNELKYSDPDEMLVFGTKALTLAQKNANTLEEGNAYLHIGTAYIILGDYEKALDHFVWAKTIFEGIQSLDIAKDKIDEGVAATYGRMGIVFSEQSNYAKALEYYLKSATIYEELQDEEQSSKIYNNIGVAYKSQFLDTKALTYFKKSLKLQEKLQSPNIGITQTNIATIYFKQKELDEAFSFYTDAKKSIDKNPNPRALGEWYNNIRAYYNSRNYKEMDIQNWEKTIRALESMQD